MRHDRLSVKVIVIFQMPRLNKKHKPGNMLRNWVSIDIQIHFPTVVQLTAEIGTDKFSAIKVMEVLE